jgi:hypothetical protein
MSPGVAERQRFTEVLDYFIGWQTPYLMASDELKGWSPLSWTGPLAYVGQRTIIDPDAAGCLRRCRS